MARDLGVPVVLNSDAHGVRELGHLRYGIGIARRAWLSAGARAQHAHPRTSSRNGAPRVGAELER